MDTVVIVLCNCEQCLKEEEDKEREAAVGAELKETEGRGRVRQILRDPGLPSQRKR